MTNEQFRKWKDRHGLSLAAAGEALGISPRMAAYYQSGEKEIPKTVHLATLAIDLAADVERMGVASVTPDVHKLAVRISRMTN